MDASPLPVVGFILQHPLLEWKNFPPKPKLSKAKRGLSTKWKVLEKPPWWGAHRAGSGQPLCSKNDKTFLEKEGMQDCNPRQVSSRMGRGAMLGILRGKGTFSINLSVSHRCKPGLCVLGTLPHSSGKPWAVPSALPALGCSSGQVSEEC